MAYLLLYFIANSAKSPVYLKSSFKFTGIIANTSKNNFLSFYSPRLRAPGRSSNGSLIVLFNNKVISAISSNGL